MELVGTTQDGKVVSADFGKFAQDNAQEGETFYGFGSSPAHARYKNKSGEMREADLREMAMIGGLNNVTVRYAENDTMKQWSQKEPIKQKDAYVLERIKGGDAAKKMYLEEQGHKNFFNNGDDYYAIKDGYIVPINNESGLDLSDLTRLGAHAGRDVGAMLGVAATGIGAAATAGGSLAAAGVAGAAGAAVGEKAQRGLDELFGSDAAKYNARLSGAEELQNTVKELGVGAIQGVGGQVVSKAWGAGKAAVSSQIAQATADTAAANVTAKYAQRAEASYLQSQLPSGFMSKTGSAETSRAQAWLDMSSSKDAPLEIMKTANEEARSLVSGKIKLSSEKALENDTQKFLAAQMKQEALKKQAAEESMAKMGELRAINAKETASTYKEKHYENAADYYKNSQVNVDEIFAEGGSLNKASAMVKKADDAMKERLKSTGGVKMVSDGAKITGVDKESLINATTQMVKQRSKNLSEVADNAANIGFHFDKVPDDESRTFASEELQRLIVNIDKSGLSEATKKDIQNNMRAVKNEIDNYNPLDPNSVDAAHTFRKFLANNRIHAEDDSLPPSVQDSVNKSSDVLFQYMTKIAKNPAQVDETKAFHKLSVTLNSLMRDQVTDQNGGIKLVLDHYDIACKKLGDDGSMVSDLAFLHNISSAINGTKNPDAWASMTAADRKASLAYEAVKNYDKFGIKKEALEKNKAVEAIEAAALYPIKKPLEIAKTVGKSAVKIAPKIADTPVAKRTAKYYGIETGGEKIKDKLQNYTSSGDNKR